MSDLKKDIDAKRREISSQNLSMSIGELLNLYKEGELNIHPEYQRVFRWQPRQKTGLVESVMLGIPLPPIYVATDESGVWEVVDGVQRLSTLFEFMGELRAPASDEDERLVSQPEFELSKTKHLPSLGGVRYSSLEQTLKLEFKRSRLDVKILARESAPEARAKFDLFERLNTYGTSLSPQELRNCVLVSLNPKFYRWLKSLAEDESFRSCTILSENQLKERYDMDLALRFLTFKNSSDVSVGEVNDFLRERMEDLATSEDFDFEREERVFRQVFKYLDARLAGDSFRPWDEALKVFRGGFSLGAFEGVAVTLASNWGAVDVGSDGFDLRAFVQALWNTTEFKKGFSGLRARDRLSKVKASAERVFKEIHAESTKVKVAAAVGAARGRVAASRKLSSGKK